MKLYNTASREVETFKPIHNKTVTLYTCGPTVYDETHIGHMRKYTMDDILKRTLKYVGYEVEHVMNITDVGHLSGDDDSGEDKLEKGAKKSGKTVWDVAKYYTDKFFETMDALNIIRPDKVVKATDHIKQMIDLVKRLEAKHLTYATDEAIYFDITKFPSYGSLSGQKLEEKKQAARGEIHIDPNKKHPADFALWFKRVGRFKDHSMHWDSPWEDGFPGWHIECSAMSMAYLGETIDIHTGGIDHIPVHHENEIAQSEAATGNKFVRFWVHHAFLNVDGEKMSKSKGNYYTLEDLKKHNIDPLAIRYLFLQTHYRQEMNFTWEAAEAAQETLEKIKKIVLDLRLSKITSPQNQSPNVNLFNDFKLQFSKSLSQDLNTSEALAVMWNMLKSKLSSSKKMELLYDFDEVFGLALKDIKKGKIPKELIELANQRIEARKAKNFKKSDELRKQIEEKGYIVEDTDGGYRIKKK